MSKEESCHDPKHVAEQDLYNLMVEMFSDRLADPEVFPTTFAHQVKLARYEKWLKDKSASSEGAPT